MMWNGTIHVQNTELAYTYIYSVCPAHRQTKSKFKLIFHVASLGLEFEV